MLQSVEEQLHLREERCVELETELAEVKRKGQREKEMLKRATKQHRSQAAQSEHTVETLSAQLEDVVSHVIKLTTSVGSCTSLWVAVIVSGLGNK